MTDREKEIFEIIKEDPMITQEEIASRTGMNRSSVAVHISNMMKKGIVLGRGYIVSESSFVTVVGGVNIDIGGKPFKKLVPKDSNPGSVNTTPGGVGRNIAHNLALLGMNVKFISALGDDNYAKEIKDSCKALSIDIHESMFLGTHSTSIYLYVSDDKGDMQLAVADMAIYDEMKPDFFKSRIEVLNHSKLVIVDANIPKASIEYLVNNIKVPVFAETVSTAKAVKFKNALSGIYCITPNVIEAEALTGEKIDVSDENTLSRAADKFLEKGVKKVVITLSKNGAYYADENDRGLLPALKNKPVNTTGAGDALIAGVASALARGYSLRDSVLFGMACSSITIETEKTNNPELSFENAAKRAGIKL